MGESMTRMGEPLPQSVQCATLHQQLAIMIDDERTEQGHEVGDGETEGSDGKVGAIASVKSKGQVKKARIEHERGRQIDQSTHANEYRHQRTQNQQDRVEDNL